jgi:hypothetical protein
VRAGQWQEALRPSDEAPSRSLAAAPAPSAAERGDAASFHVPASGGVPRYLVHVQSRIAEQVREARRSRAAAGGEAGEGGAFEVAVAPARAAGRASSGASAPAASATSAAAPAAREPPAKRPQWPMKAASAWKTWANR